MRVHLLELQQKGIMPFRTVDVPQRRIRDPSRYLLLLGKGEETITFDAYDECWLLDLGEGFGGGVGFIGRDAVPGDVVGVELAGDGNVAVGVEAVDEFVALVAEVGLS